MNTIDLKEEVRRALKSEWPRFAIEHPRLAAVMDESLLLEPAIEALNDDAEFREAMETAASIGAAGEVVAGVVNNMVNKWLRQLL
jgi:hypothetical protein